MVAQREIQGKLPTIQSSEILSEAAYRPAKGRESAARELIELLLDFTVAKIILAEVAQSKA